MKEIAKLFDETETPIELMANGGKGYGSVWNMAALLLMLVALVVGLILLGLFEVSAQYSAQTCIPSEEKDFMFVLKKDRFVFRPMLEKAIRKPNGLYFDACVIDEKGNVIEAIEVVSGSQCNQPVGEESFTWHCFNKDVIIYNKYDQFSYIMLYLKTNSTSRIDQILTKTLTTKFYYQ